jgi:hypothetical protein
MSTSYKIPKTPDVHCIQEVYNNCMKFSLKSRGFIKNTENLRRMSITTEILATKAGKNGRTVGVIVKEIVLQSLDISAILEEIVNAGTKLAKNSVHSIKLTHQQRQYEKAWKAQIDKQNTTLFLSSWNKKHNSLYDLFNKITEQLKQHRRDMLDFSKATRNIPMASSLLSIVATEMTDYQDQLDFASRELTRFDQFFKEKTDEISNLIIVTIDLLSNMEKEYTGEDTQII